MSSTHEIVQGVGGIAVVGGLLYGVFRLFMWQMGKVAALQKRPGVIARPTGDQPSDQ